jgi:catechol 2,3-dioxygenase-like lactoylglutathione lyase family enzyme
LPVASLEAALGWYERLFGREPDMRPNDTEACWRVAEGRWVYIVVDADRAGGGIVTLIVDDLSAFGDLETEPVGGLRSAWLTDPDGNRVQLAGT